MERVLVLLGALVVLSAVFGLVEWRWPAVAGQRRLRTGWLTDSAYWLFTPLVSKPFSSIVVFISILALAQVVGAGISGDDLRTRLVGRETWITVQPVWLQLLGFILLADLIAYWQHRAFHHIGRLWRIHAIHHSSTEVDWLSSVRLHPLNDAIASSVVAAPLLVLGFMPGALAAYLPFLTLYAIFVHANVRWDMGPLRYVITTPAFHRWHHSAEAEALNKNFAGLLPVWDMLFGTWYMPRDKVATHFGVVGEVIPAGLVGQLVYPFRSPKKLASPATL
jgi:sterol desaturase/sphingolipid hydroxylase (fatty acid hydroxylase superfamily)